MNLRTLFGAGLMLATAATLAVTPGASAAEGDLLVSFDGTEFTPVAERPVFVNPPAFVPLESETRSVWLRNDSGVDGELRVFVDDIELSSTELAQNLEFAARETRTGGGTTSVAGDLDPCSVVVPTYELDSGETMRVDLSVGLRDVPAQVAQQESFRFSLTAVIRHADVDAPWPDGCDDGTEVPVFDTDPPGVDDDDLAVTGSAVPIGAIALGGALVLVGTTALFLVRKRRRRDRA